MRGVMFTRTRQCTHRFTKTDSQKHCYTILEIDSVLHLKTKKHHLFYDFEKDDIIKQILFSNDVSDKAFYISCLRMNNEQSLCTLSRYTSYCFKCSSVGLI